MEKWKRNFEWIFFRVNFKFIRHLSDLKKFTIHSEANSPFTSKIDKPDKQPLKKVIDRVLVFLITPKTILFIE